METVLTCTVFGAFIVLSYTLGLRNGQKLVKQEEIEMPNPVKAVKQSIELKKETEILNEYQKLFDNIDNYNAPGYEQKDVKINE